MNLPENIEQKKRGKKMGMTYNEYASFNHISRKDFVKQFSKCQCKYCGEPLTDGYFCKTCFKNGE